MNRNRIINLKSSKIIGVGNTHLTEINPRYNKSESEKIIEGENNTWITLGRDRPSDIFSGFGGAGEKKCGSIDLVAGRISSLPMELKDGQELTCDNNVFLDASRININQKTNVDDNYFLAKGSIGKRNNKAAIVIKSDNLRFISREGIKLITGTDKYDSNGNLINRIFGIDLIAGNDDSDLQPLVKGKNIEEYLNLITSTVARHGSELANIYKMLIQLNTVLAAHIHPFAGPVTGPSIEMIAQATIATSESAFHAFNLQTEQVNLTTQKMNYLYQFGKKYINSRFNNTN